MADVDLDGPRVAGLSRILLGVLHAGLIFDGVILGYIKTNACSGDMQLWVLFASTAG